MNLWTLRGKWEGDTRKWVSQGGEVQLTLLSYKLLLILQLDLDVEEVLALVVLQVDLLLDCQPPNLLGAII